MVLTWDQELWGVALWVDKNHGDQGEAYVAGQIERLAAAGNAGGEAMWRDIDNRLKQLRAHGSAAS